MIIEVIALARHEDGTPHWTYQHVEQFIPVEDEEVNAVRLAGAVIERLDEASTSIATQADIDLTRLRGEKTDG